MYHIYNETTTTKGEKEEQQEEEKQSSQSLAQLYYVLLLNFTLKVAYLEVASKSSERPSFGDR